MTTSLAFCANTGDSLIDLPQTEPNDDAQASLQAAVQWHFGPDTRPRYWLNRAKTLEYNPLTDVKTFENRPRSQRRLPRGLPHAQPQPDPRLRAEP
jgi:hypothetical protein